MDILIEKRNYNLDLIKSVAIFFVIFSHYFLNTGFYSIEYTNKIITVSFVLKNLSVTCVPLFLIVTGYLMNQKEPSKKYYLNLIITLVKYMLISIICLIVRKFILYDHTSIKQLIIGIFTFETNPYSWYVNMYIGLYILIPFLNIIIRNIKDNKKLFIFNIVLLSLLTSIPKFINYWVIIYPINYYFIGAYIQYYRPEIKKYINVFLIICCIFLELMISHFIGKNANIFNSYGMFLNLIKSISIFLLLNSFQIKKRIRALEVISKHTLSIYLFSFVIDTIIYKHFNQYFITYEERFFYIYIVILIFTLSLIFALCLDTAIYFFIRKLERI